MNWKSVPDDHLNKVEDFNGHLKIQNWLHLFSSLWTGATIWSYYSIAKLDINPNPISFLDDLLLLICIPSYFLYGLLNIISGVDGDDLESSVSTNMFMVGFFQI